MKKLKDRKRTEKEITAEIRQWLKVCHIYHWKVMQGLGAHRGVSDILGILPGGRLLAIEVKTNAGKPTPHQEDFLWQINQRGGLGIVARGIEDLGPIVDAMKFPILTAIKPAAGDAARQTV